MTYSNFAEFYDGLQSDVDYDKRAEYLLNLFEKYDRLPTLLLDVACGTGGFSLYFAKKGIDIIGVDNSIEMLCVAREKFNKAGKDALLICQSADELDLYGTVDGAVCCLDSLNHIIDNDEFKRSLKKIALFLEPQRLFIFDLNTEYKHRNILSGNTFTIENEDVFCVWQNSECYTNGIVDISLDFFKKNTDGTYTRSCENFSERAYSKEFINDCLADAGLELVVTLGDMSLEKEGKNEERVIYVTRKVE